MSHGAEIHAREQVLSWEAHPNGEGVVVSTDRGRYEAGRLVITAGAWIGELAPVARRLAIPERQVLAWLQPTRPDWFTTQRFPVFNLEVEEGRYYGFPVYEVPGFKFGRYHHRGESCEPDLLRRDPDVCDEALLRQFAGRYFPEGNGPTMALRTCMRFAPACSRTRRMSISLSIIIPRISRLFWHPPAPATATNSAASSEKS
jgi:sarcosine oxidase